MTGENYLEQIRESPYRCRESIIVAPIVYPVTSSGRYGGIERLAALFLRGLTERGYQVDLIAARGSKTYGRSQLIDAGPPVNDFAEAPLRVLLADLVKEKRRCTILDFSHSHPSRYFPEQPSMSVIWHDPALMQPPPTKNVVALSNWQAERYYTYQGTYARVLDPICADHTFFSPKGPVGDRFLVIGKIHPSKGALEAARICRKAGRPLDIVGPLTADDPPEYLRAILEECDGESIVYHGEVSEETKLDLIRSAKALLYPVSYPPGTGEAHSHKMVEVMMAGTPCIAYDQGAMREVIDNNVTGYHVNSPSEFAEALTYVEKIDRAKCRQRAIERWSFPAVMARWLPVMRRVCQGERW